MKRSLSRSKLIMGILVLSSVISCTEQRDALVLQYPALGPILGGRAKPSPPVIRRGSVQGFVYGAKGVEVPIPLAFVTSGGSSTLTGNPPGAEECITTQDEADKFQDDSKTIFVLHDYDDGKKEVPAERRARKFPPAIDPADEQGWQKRYMYLRKGEFFLENIPAGNVTLTATYGGAVSAENRTIVFANNILTGIALNVLIPESVAAADPSLPLPRVVQWTNTRPTTGIVVRATVKENSEGGVSRIETSLAYEPDPPDIQVTLKAPPGSQGVMVNAVELTYEFTTLARSLGGLPVVQYGPVRYGIPPKQIPAAQQNSFGPPEEILVPIGSSTLKSFFNAPDPKDQPALINVLIKFRDDEDNIVQNEKFKDLVVTTSLRAL